MSDNTNRNSIGEEKESLRKTIIKDLSSLDAEVKQNASASISNKLIKLVRTNSSVLCYSPLKSEPNIRPAIQHWLKSNFRVCLPRVEGDQIQIYSVNSSDSLINSSMGILEPGPSNHNKISPMEIDFILVPGIGFTRDGKRLGRGGGFYDKYLEKTSSQSLKIGVAFNLQILDEIRTETHDIPVDLLITE
ncbi:5-formyltetrahydrofolate cyclo-ligase [Verrucomicrobiales bacterium]|nr:5-formyltetrahydrofolate cyclo-ligase [Verrucomicrobiales bacterium]